MVFKINKSCARRTTDSDWWAVPYARFLSASPYRNDGIQTALQTRQNGCSFYRRTPTPAATDNCNALHRTIVRSTWQCISRVSTYHSIEIRFRRTGPASCSALPEFPAYATYGHHPSNYTEDRLPRRNACSNNVPRLPPGRERHMEIPFRQGSADACFQCPIAGA